MFFHVRDDVTSLEEKKPLLCLLCLCDIRIICISSQVMNTIFCSVDFLISAAVAEFKGPVILGVVRLAQVNMELARIEANFSGLSPGKHGWSINEFGDLTNGAASTGKVFNPTSEGLANEVCFDIFCFLLILLIQSIVYKTLLKLFEKHTYQSA